MKRLLLGIIVGLALGGAGVWFYQKQHPGAEPKEEKKEEKKEESRVIHTTNGATFIKLDKETQDRIGLKAAPLEAFSLKPEVKGYGRVLDPTPLAALVAEIASARAALDASTKEFERLSLLNKQGQNASTRAVEAAEAAVKRDRILVDAAELKLVTAWGKPIASQPDLPGFVHSLATLQTTLVRVDLPLGHALKSPPLGCHVAAPASEEDLFEAQLLGPATSADPQTQGQGFFFLLRTNAFPPGAAVVAWLSTAGEAENGVIVPRAAPLRHEGGTFIYLQTASDTFQRKEIELEHPTETGWFVGEGLKPQEKVVIVGAQQLLSEELKGQLGGE